VEKERDRLGALEAVFDHASTRRLADLGVGAGRRCLEVGCGAGGVALWLAAQVGPTGGVLTTDLDTRFVTGHAQSNLDVQALVAGLPHACGAGLNLHYSSLLSTSS